MITREELTLILTALCIISLNQSAAHFPARLISQGVNSRAQYGLVNSNLLNLFAPSYTKS
jgi:hypothetical protein